MKEMKMMRKTTKMTMIMKMEFLKVAVKVKMKGVVLDQMMIVVEILVT